MFWRSVSFDFRSETWQAFRSSSTLSDKNYVWILVLSTPYTEISSSTRWPFGEVMHHAQAISHINYNLHYAVRIYGLHQLTFEGTDSKNGDIQSRFFDKAEIKVLHHHWPCGRTSKPIAKGDRGWSIGTFTNLICRSFPIFLQKQIILAEALYAHYLCIVLLPAVDMPLLLMRLKRQQQPWNSLNPNAYLCPKQPNHFPSFRFDGSP